MFSECATPLPFYYRILVAFAQVAQGRIHYPLLQTQFLSPLAWKQQQALPFRLVCLRWDVIRMAVLCGGVEAAGDPEWKPEDEDPIYESEKLMLELELEEKEAIERNPYLNNYGFCG